MRSEEEKELMNVMYGGTTTLEQFNWDKMRTVPILSLMSMQDIDYIRKLILSPRYSGNNKYKMDKIDEVMHFRGFTRFAGGTNRLVYIHPAAPNAVFKVAIDSVGITDNPAEYHNQELLKPYCCKVFECSPCGTIASFERVYRITTFDEFYQIADDYFYILSRKIIGKYVMEDIGINFFMNVGIRIGCHPVILDFPYLYELDGRKLKCGNELDDGTICGGEIDYDDGFNKLICKKCGRIYRARDLAKPPEVSRIFTINTNEEENKNMTTRLYRGKRIVRLMENDTIIFDEKMMGITYDQWKEEQRKKEEEAMLQKHPTEEISYAEPAPTVSVPEVEPETVAVVPEVVEEPKSVEPEQPEEINFDQMKQIIHDNTTEESIPEESHDKPKEETKDEVENPVDKSSDSKPDEQSDDEEEDNIEYEIVAKLPPKEEMKEDVLYFVARDDFDINEVKKVYSGVNSFIIDTNVCTPYIMHDGNVYKAFYVRGTNDWLIDAANPIEDKKDPEPHDHEDDTKEYSNPMIETDKDEKSPEHPKDDTKEYSNPMIEMLKSKSNVKINLEDFI